jgi:ketosteroid isomerase-like protein
MQSGIDVVQELYRVALAGPEEAVAQLVTPDTVWEIRESFPHGGIYTGLPAILGQFLPKLRADFRDWKAQPEEFVGVSHLLHIAL